MTSIPSSTNGGTAVSSNAKRFRPDGAEDAEFFRIGDRVFLAIACIRTGRGPYLMNTRSVLYEWREDRFVAFQQFASFAAKQWRHFTVGDRHFLALAQGVSMEGAEPAGFDHLRVDGRLLRTVPDDSPVVGAYNWEFFELAGVPYLALADHARSSLVHRWNGASFEPFQSFGDGCGRAFAFFEADGDAYLAFADLERETRRSTGGTAAASLRTRASMDPAVAHLPSSRDETGVTLFASTS